MGNPAAVSVLLAGAILVSTGACGKSVNVLSADGSTVRDATAGTDSIASVRNDTRDVEDTEGSKGAGGVTGTGGVSGTGGTQDLCAGRLGFCRLLCQGGICDCFCETGVGGAPGTGGSGGAGADAAVVLDALATRSCPQTPPSSGAACVMGRPACFYEECPGTGRTQASCNADGKWVIETGACGRVTCMGVYVNNVCDSGQVCRVRAGGALIVDCIANACGAGPASADCSTFTTGCPPTFSTAFGVTYYCNTCPQGGCP